MVGPRTPLHRPMSHTLRILDPVLAVEVARGFADLAKPAALRPPTAFALAEDAERQIARHEIITELRDQAAECDAAAMTHKLKGRHAESDDLNAQAGALRYAASVLSR